MSEQFVENEKLKLADEPVEMDLDEEEMDRLIVPSPSDPMAVARQFVAERYVAIGGALLLRHHRGDFYRYAGDHWPADDLQRIRAELWRWLEPALYWRAGRNSGEPELAPFQPNKSKIENVLEALRAIGHIHEGVQPPVWIDASGVGLINAGEFVPLANGILEFASRTLQPHTPGFFCSYVLPFDFDSGAPTPVRWQLFLDELWPDDEESQLTLGEWFGYVLSSETAQQKMYLLVGPKRSGKGTIARVLRGLLGTPNVAGPTLASLTQNFGLQPLIGKPLAVVSDARLGRRADSTIAVERLLSISGEDTLTIDRKYLPPWTGQLPTRFQILTNELPRFSDASGALASRFVISILTRSFYGEENPNLTAELLHEAPAIFNWALEGLDRLRERGHFATPASAREAQRHLEDLASPVGAFVRDCCKVGASFSATTDELWAAWKDWCVEEGAAHGTKAVFTRDLRANTPGLVPIRPREGEERRRGYRGIGLQPNLQSSGPRTTLDQAAETDDGPESRVGQIPLNHAVGPGWSRVRSNVDRERRATSDQNEASPDLTQPSGRVKAAGELTGDDVL